MPDTKMVVVTGASSGIGRATALALAERGDHVAAAARSSDALHALAAEPAAEGRIHPVTVDVTDADQVAALAREAAGRFGRIDVWVNNAAVMLFGSVEETPPESFRRIFEVNLLGYVHGAHAALPHFRAQKGGTVVNVSSYLGKMALPFIAPYEATKFAVQGFSKGLNQELKRERGIRVCSVLLGAVDTAIYAHAANYHGRKVKPLFPYLSVDRTVEVILRAIDRPRRHRTVGWAGRLGMLAQTTGGPVYEWVTGKLGEIVLFGRDESTISDGNLFTPSDAAATPAGR